MKLILFDFDGTLCDDVIESWAIFNRLADEFGYRKIDANNREAARALGTRALMRDLGIPFYMLPFIARRAREELRAKVDTFSPFPGIPRVIYVLAGRGAVMGILSSNSATNIRRFLQQHQMDRFRFISSATSIFGKGSRIRAVLRANSLSATDVAYVGDETRDIEAAKSAGVLAVAVTWGFNSRSVLEQQGPDRLCDQPQDLLELGL